MSTDIFSVDKKSLDQITKYFKEFPDKIKPATAAVINGLAFGTRTTSIKTIGKQMTVRSPSYVSRGLRVQKASYRQPIEQQQAKLYTTQGSGWTEQEFGAKIKSTRTIIGRVVRGPSFKKTMLKKYRYNSPYHKIDDFKFNNTGMAKRWGYIAFMQRKHNKEPFVLDRKTGGLMPGGMVFQKNRLQRISYHDKTYQPKHKPWMQPSAKRYINSDALARIWQKELQRLFNKRIN